MAAVASAPRWGDVLTASTVAAALAAGLLYATATGRQALVDQWERTAIAFGQEVDDGRYAELIELSEYGVWYGVAGALVTGPVATFAVAAAGLMLLRGEKQPRFRQVLAVAAHAGLILALRTIVGAPVSYMRETTASATSLGVWFPMLDEGTPAARFLGLLDLFALWWVIVLAIGFGLIFGRPARRLAPAFVGLYLTAATALAVAMSILGAQA
jgi:hypothetical protein